MKIKSTPIDQLRSTVQNDVNQYLEEYFLEQIAHAKLLEPQYARLWEALSELISSGGKRLRPYMTMLGYSIFGGQNYDKVLPVAAAQELLHQSLLIHDDIIDRDYVRYGRSNISGMYIDYYSATSKDDAETTHYAQSAALLAGDLALSAAYQLIIKSGLDPQQILQAQEIMGRAVFAVAGGELLDTEATLQPIEAIDALKIASMKTASYSCIAPLVTGATIAGASEKDVKYLSEYGEALGIAYQIADDLLGVFGDESVTGKSATSDIAEGKRTFMLQYAYANSKENRQLLDKFIGKYDINEAEADIVRKVFIDSGAVEASKSLIQEHSNKAFAALVQIGIDEQYKKELRLLVESSTKRAY
jgi:geranylgeranyl pyrophosphate synthase